MQKSQNLHIQKLDPKLKTLIADASVSPDTIEPIARTSEGDPLYAVIIYTSNADSLRSLGIPIHSELKNFVTARLTRQQIKQCITQDFIQYLEAGRKNQPDGR